MKVALGTIFIKKLVPNSPSALIGRGRTKNVFLEVLAAKTKETCWFPVCLDFLQKPHSVL
jgi:hypothetical protein